jgi:hypothetical protein
MSRLSVLAAGVSAAVVGATVYAAAPAAKPVPIATYWMDVATQSGMGAGMMGGGARPSSAQIMAMMNGGGGQAIRTLDLRLASKQKPTAAPAADHLIPAGLQMGPSLPLLTPVREEAPQVKSDGMPTNFQRPKGRMLIYWGCGEHVAAGEPTVIDFSKIEPGKVPPGMAALASMAHAQSGPTSAPGFGRWPNERDSRQVPVSGSLVGAHKVQANYAPPIAFDLGAGQDFMPGLGLREAGALPSGASRLVWQQAPTATGYALAMFGANATGDVVMWTSARSAQMPAMDYLTPGEVKRLVAAGSVLPPSASECVLPAEVAAASRTGMVMMIGYGPEADFSDNPKAPKWATKVRYKTTASLIRGMGGYGGYAANGEDAQQPPQQPQQQQPPKKRRIGIGDLLGAIPH